MPRDFREAARRRLDKGKQFKSQPSGERQIMPVGGFKPFGSPMRNRRYGTNPVGTPRVAPK